MPRSSNILLGFHLQIIIRSRAISSRNAVLTNNSSYLWWNGKLDAFHRIEALTQKTNYLPFVISTTPNKSSTHNTNLSMNIKQ